MPDSRAEALTDVRYLAFNALIFADQAKDQAWANGLVDEGVALDLVRNLVYLVYRSQGDNPALSRIAREIITRHGTLLQAANRDCDAFMKHCRPSKAIAAQT
jgi:hypothetical protein